jgi:hypothetical protein
MRPSNRMICQLLNETQNDDPLHVRDGHPQNHMQYDAITFPWSLSVARQLTHRAAVVLIKRNCRSEEEHAVTRLFLIATHANKSDRAQLQTDMSDRGMAGAHTMHLKRTRTAWETTVN